jgi:hypothetical protein
MKSPSLSPELVRELEQAIASGEAILFTGAGFSLGARDMAGDPLPDSETMRRELFALIFGDHEPPDDSSLEDLYDVALSRAPRELDRYLERRLRVGSLCDVERYAAWFSLPWRRVYTLNVDDLEAVLARCSRLPRALRTVSATHELEGARASGDALEVVHLNGVASAGAATLTFSTLQYAARLCSQDREYRALVENLGRSPFVFVGTTLDEVVLFQHLELHRRGRDPNPARRSYLIARTLSRARQLLLEDLGLVWISTSIEELSQVLQPLRDVQRQLARDAPDPRDRRETRDDAG